MAIVTRGWPIKSTVRVALLTVALVVVLIQKLSRDAVVERRRAPLIVARVALSAKPGKGHACVAVSATSVFVKPAQRPAGTGVVKRLGLWLTLPPMAAPASGGLPARQIHVTLVAPDALSMVVGGRTGSLLLLGACVAPRAASLMVALYASEAETVCVLPVAEDHLRLCDRQGPAAVDIGIRLRDRTVHHSQDVILRWRYHPLVACGHADFLAMTNVAVPLVDPLSVTAQTLLVVCTSESRPVNIGLRVRNCMTRAASRVFLAFGRVMMTGNTALDHLCHLGVALVVERNGQVGTLELVEDDYVRSPVARHVRTAWSRAGPQAPVLERRDLAQVARTTVGILCCLGGRGVLPGFTMPGWHI